MTAAAVADIADQDVDFLYLGSSSFLLANAEMLTSSALGHDLPLATAYEAMVRESDALIALASPYYNVGQLAGFQAERILTDGQQPEGAENASQQVRGYVAGTFTGCVIGPFAPFPASDCLRVPRTRRSSSEGAWRRYFDRLCHRSCHICSGF